METAEGTRTYSKNTHRVREKLNNASVTLTCRREHGRKRVLHNALNIKKITVIIEALGGEKENTLPQRVYQGV